MSSEVRVAMINNKHSLQHQIGRFCCMNLNNNTEYLLVKFVLKNDKYAMHLTMQLPRMSATKWQVTKVTHYNQCCTTLIIVFCFQWYIYVF